jgi:hypothetical protein
MNSNPISISNLNSKQKLIDSGIFQKLGLEEFLSDPIFNVNKNLNLSKNDSIIKSKDEINESRIIIQESVMNRGKFSVLDKGIINFGNNLIDICVNCDKEINNESFSFFSKKLEICFYCKKHLCENCLKIVQKRSDNFICNICDKKFKLYDNYKDFLTEYEKIEMEIKESSQETETYTLKYSESCNDLESIKEELNLTKKTFEENSTLIKNNINELTLKKNESDILSQKTSAEINSLIEELKILENTSKELNQVKESLLIKREEVYKDHIKKQDYLNKLNKENQELNINISLYDEEISKRIVIDINKSLKILYLEPIKIETKNNSK